MGVHARGRLKSLKPQTAFSRCTSRRFYQLVEPTEELRAAVTLLLKPWIVTEPIPVFSWGDPVVGLFIVPVTESVPVLLNHHADPPPPAHSDSD
jgi:hypothetical protein